MFPFVNHVFCISISQVLKNLSRKILGDFEVVLFCFFHYKV
jgi:hypothetical protein